MWFALFFPGCTLFRLVISLLIDSLTPNLIILVQVNTAESSLLITEPYFNLPNVQDIYDQFVFEEYEFRSYFRCTRESPLTR